MVSLLLDVWLLKSEAFLLVYNLEEEADDEGGNAEAGKHDEGSGVVELCGVGHTLVGGYEHLADEQREEPEADVLNPEDESVGRADNLCVNELRHTGPERCGHERERGTEHQDGHVSNDHAAYLVALEGRKHEGEGEVTSDEQE